jgi:exosortase
MNTTNTLNSTFQSSATIKFLALITLWAAAFIPIYPQLIDTLLNRPNNSHGILVPFIAVFLIWHKRGELRKKTVVTYIPGALIFIGAMLLYVIAYAGLVAVVCRTMIVFSLIGLVLFVLGKEIFKEIRFPLFFLLFMVPVPDSIYGQVALPLQTFATIISTDIIQMLGIVALREGNRVYFANTQLEVAEACSGLRSMMAFVMLSFLFTYFMSRKVRWKMCVMVLSAIPLALFANILRVTGTGILANFYGDKVARGFLHEFSGMVVFAFGFVLLLLEYQWLGKSRKKR